MSIVTFAIPDFHNSHVAAFYRHAMQIAEAELQIARTNGLPLDDASATWDRAWRSYAACYALKIGA